MERIDIKPLSLNNAYRGRRFITPNLEAYKQELAYKLPKLRLYGDRFSVSYIFGVSSKNADVDNLIKCFQDALASKYGFNDKQIYSLAAVKLDVKKGEEFVEFSIKAL